MRRFYKAPYNHDSSKKVFNMGFHPTFFYLFPKLWLISLPFNFVIDSAVLLLGFKIFGKEKVWHNWKKSILLSWIFGYISDIVATFLMLVFCITLKWLPVWDASNKSLILPVIALAAYPMAYVTRLTKTSMLDSLGQDYIRTARAKGVPMTKVIFKHALRNALIPVITYVGPMLAYILTGSLVVENIFTIGGLGQQFVKSINNRDYPMIMATTIFLAVVMVICNLLSDIAYKVVDPRITLD